MELTFYDYWRSSSAYRVRIVLNLKGVDFRGVEIDLAAGEQDGEAYRAINPLGLVPTLVADGEAISQSLAIIDFLDSQFPEPRMIPLDPLERARTLAQAMTIIADIQPIANLRVQRYLRRELEADEGAVQRWIGHWITGGFDALEQQAPDEGFFGGDAPNLVDAMLVPQMYNARRFSVPLEAWPRLVRIDKAARRIDAIAQAAPEAVRAT